MEAKKEKLFVRETPFRSWFFLRFQNPQLAGTAPFPVK
jgi:hypothetical protein